MKYMTGALFISAVFVLAGGPSLGLAVAEDSDDGGHEASDEGYEMGIAVPAVGGNGVNYVPQGIGAGSDLFPPNARPGGCYARVLVPARYSTETIQMVKSEASERLEVIPATFKSFEETIVVQEASEKLEVVPATYEWVQEQVMVKPGFEKLISIPAEYEMVSEQVIDKPAHVIWEKGRGLIEKVDFGTGEIVCLTEVPATFRTVTKQVLKNPATTRTQQVPAEYKMVKRRLMKTPPITRSVIIPEQVKIQKGLQIVEPVSVRRIAIPEELQTVTKQVEVSAEKMSWKSVLCETNTTPQIVRQLQQSLKEQGFHPGPVDGTLGASTMKAVVAFQKKEGLPRGGLDMDTFRALKVNLPWISEAMVINTGNGALR
jgi:hypothetical protein